MDWTFAELIERASYGADLYPGDIIGSGTVGTGCFLELNGTGRLSNAEFNEQWLQPDDKIELKIEGLGVLANIITREDDDFPFTSLECIGSVEFDFFGYSLAIGTLKRSLHRNELTFVGGDDTDLTLEVYVLVIRFQPCV